MAVGQRVEDVPPATRLSQQPPRAQQPKVLRCQALADPDRLGAFPHRSRPMQAFRHQPQANGFAQLPEQSRQVRCFVLGHLPIDI